jgi:integrase
MTLVKLKHIHRFRDRHGTVRHYLRIPGTKAVALPGTPGTAEFLAAYTAAMAAAPNFARAERVIPGTLNALAVAWYASSHFRSLRSSTQANYRRHCEKLREAHGDKPIRLLDAIGVRRLLAERTTSTGPHHLLRVLRGLMAFAVETGLLPSDPTAGVKRSRHKTKGFRTWTEGEIAQFEAHWPSGSKPRLALALLLYTAHRRSDIVQLGRQHVSVQVIAGLSLPCIVHTQSKTGKRVVTPIAPELAAELAHAEGDRLAFLTRENGQPYSANGFYNVFVDWCRAAGLPPGLAPHGLRKAMGRRLAEAGATTRENMAILGHTTLSEAENYTRDAEAARLAATGMDRIVNRNSQTRK